MPKTRGRKSNIPLNWRISTIKIFVVYLAGGPSQGIPPPRSKFL
ncbi:hypothetical protein [Achromobacter phage tuull]|nr:hypothetical protein [Achromobacter phage tuull]